MHKESLKHRLGDKFTGGHGACECGRTLGVKVLKYEVSMCIVLKTGLGLAPSLKGIFRREDWPSLIRSSFAYYLACVGF